MRDINDLYCFAEVVAHGGFAQAGRALRQPKSKLSRRIAQLEKRLGVRLLEPSTRRFRVTKVGQAFYERCRGVVAEAETRRASQIPTIWSCGAQAPRKGRRRIMRQHGRTGSKIDLAHNFKIQLRARKWVNDRHAVAIGDRTKLSCVNIRALPDQDGGTSHVVPRRSPSSA